MKRRITLVVDDVRHLDLVERMSVTYSGVTIESVEDIPEPIRQQFMVYVESEPELGRLSAGSFEHEMHGFSVRKVSAVEVEAT